MAAGAPPLGLGDVYPSVGRRKYDVEQLSLFMYEHTRYSLADDAYEEGKPAS